MCRSFFCHIAEIFSTSLIVDQICPLLSNLQPINNPNLTPFPNPDPPPPSPIPTPHPPHFLCFTTCLPYALDHKSRCVCPPSHSNCKDIVFYSNIHFPQPKNVKMSSFSEGVPMSSAHFYQTPDYGDCGHYLLLPSLCPVIISPSWGASRYFSRKLASLVDYPRRYSCQLFDCT